MRNEEIALRDILDCCQRIGQFVAGQTFESFQSDRMRQDAVLYRIAVIGEAVGTVTDQTRLKLAHIPWPKIRRMRNFVIHDYFNVDLAIVWLTTQQSVPELLAAVQSLAGGAGGSGGTP